MMMALRGGDPQKAGSLWAYFRRGNPVVAPALRCALWAGHQCWLV